VTPLAKKLKSRIRAAGPMTIADFMAACLGDPEHGYYMQREPFGESGDFITAPEISQIFGELIGLWAVAAWELMGEPDDFAFVELGPGRGTLMADMVRTALVKVPFLRAARFHLVENSPRLRQVQEKTLAPTGLDFTWHDRMEDIPPGPAIVIANEFFDALPVRQFQWREGKWSERVIGLDGDDGFVVGLAPVERQPSGLDLPDETIVEASPASAAIMENLAARLVQHGGAALVIDYGSIKPGVGDTLQAVADHKYQDPFARPGEADLTAHVDFSALARAATGAGGEVRPVMTQGEFLIRLGLVERANVLGREKDTATRDKIASAIDRLAGPKAMGNLFKVLPVSAPGQRLPVFDADRPAPDHQPAEQPESSPPPKSTATKPKSKPRAKRRSKGKEKPTTGHEKDRTTKH
jgi:NADH dehydrogenase [ubiquinone] 1 alpha subcomplex assembly factor 7